MKALRAPALLSIAWPFLSVVAVLTALALFSLDTLSASRAFASGESLWSKAQKRAVQCLRQHAHGAADGPRACFDTAMAVPLGILQAHRALTARPADHDGARRGLLSAGSDPTDVGGMVRLLQLFGHLQVVQDALATWTDADLGVIELQALGQRLYEQVAAQQHDEALVTLAQIDEVDQRLTKLGRRFADRVSAAARQAAAMLMVASLSAATLLAVLGLLTTWRLLQRVERATQALHGSERRLQLAIAASDHGIFDLDLSSGQLYVSPHVLEGLGHGHWPASLSIDTLLAQVHADDLERVQRLLHSDCSHGTRRDFEFRLRSGDGQWRWLRACGSTFGDGADRQRRLAGALSDVTGRRTAEDRLLHQASHDEVTGLLNRREFERRLGLAIDGARQRDERHALMMIDLDQFKIINDTSGHAAGDELLRQVATLLKQQLRAGDSLGRLGGDEFGVLLGHCAPAPAAQVAEALRQTLADFRFVANGRPFPISASIGLVHLDGAAIDRTSALSAADSACHAAKECGRNRVHAYHVTDGELAARQDMMGWVTRIQQALDEDRLCLGAQPILPADPDRHEPPHRELLLRMMDREGRIVAPMAFIPAAERYGLMPGIDRWVVRTAFARIAQEAAPGVYAINLSGVSVGDQRFLDVIRAEQQRFGVDPARICFEITETAAISHLDSAMHFMATLRDMGFRFALDDFGAGMSSFGYLKHLPVDYLKIDGAFVKDMLRDPIDAAMVEAIHRIGQVMGMRTIAEFVDGPHVRARLAALGVNYVQGFGVGPPRPFVRPALADRCTHPHPHPQALPA